MPTVTRLSGVRIEAPADVRVTDIPPAAKAPTGGPATSRRRGRVPIPTGPIPSTITQPPRSDPIVESMEGQDLDLLDAFEIEPPAVRRGTRAPSTAMPSSLATDINEDEDAVVLLEQDGLYAWRFPAQTVVRPAARRRGPLLTPARKTVTFDLNIPERPTAVTRRRRGPISDFFVGKVRMYVFKFIAKVAAKPVIGFLERKVRTGFMVMDSDDATAWRRVEDLASLELPVDRPARILLFVHGTFSSTLGSYGHLSGSEWGRAFLRAARTSYDAVIGYDHASLSLTPADNASDLLARIEIAEPGVPLQIDAIAFSRGALVLRSFIEQLLPSSRLNARVQRAIFVGGTNGGTLLAAPEHWERLVDLYTNLAAAGCRAFGMLAPAALAAMVLREAVQTLGALIKHLAAAMVKDRAVPGLWSMWPNGDFVKEINRTQLGQPTIADSFYCVVTSEFDISLFEKGQGAGELPARLAKWMLDGLSDSLMRESSDLVVNTRSMSEIDPHAGVFVKQRYDFGVNPHVYHTIYFTRPEVVKALTTWLELETPAATTAHRSRGVIGAAQGDLLVVNVEQEFAVAMGAIARREPQYVIVEQPEGKETFRYAFRAEELFSLDRDLPARLRKPGLTLHQAIDSATDMALHENTSSSEIPASDVKRELQGDGLTGRRGIVMDGAVAIGVLEPPGRIPSSAELGLLQEQIAAADARTSAKPPSFSGRGTRSTHPEIADRIARRRAMPSAQDGRALTTERDTRAMYHFASRMPEEIALKKTVSLEVTLSRDVIEVKIGAATATASGTVDETREVLVQVLPRTQNVEIVGEDHESVDPASQAHHDLVFDVKGIKAGPAELLVRVRQGPSVLASMTLAPKVVAKPKKNPAPIADVAAARAPDPIRSSPILQIFEQPPGGRKGLRFLFNLLFFEQGLRPVSGRTKPLQVNRKAYVAKLYKEIEERWVGSNEDAQAFERELRSYGGMLYENLVPTEIQQALWEQRDKLKAIQVVSEEPFIPWEILHFKEPQVPGQPPKPLPRESHFFGEKGLVRWLSNYPDAPAGLRIRSGKAFHIVPDYPEKRYKLPAAQEEIPFLEAKLHAQKLDGNSNAVIDQLSQAGTIDLLHFSGHGEADAKDAKGAKVMLQGRLQAGNYIPDLLRAIDIQQNAQLTGASGCRPLVVLNACQAGRMGWHLTELGGFAEAFLRQGAGGFVGALWEVGDINARYFCEAFYSALLNNRTLAEATKAGRDAAKEKGESSWLAYVVYGYPHAMLTLA